jgi:lysozyme family protein
MSRSTVLLLIAFGEVIESAKDAVIGAMTVAAAKAAKPKAILDEDIVMASSFLVRRDHVR